MDRSLHKKYNNAIKYENTNIKYNVNILKFR